jgi:hypothetical protein
MKLKVISTASSKKGKKYLSVEIIEGNFPATGDILEVEYNPPEEISKSPVEIEADEAYERATKKYGG